MFWTVASGVAAGVVVVSAAGTALLCRALRRRAILDHPNERSSHNVATPRGAGLAVVGALLAGWLALALIYSGGGLWLILGAGAASRPSPGSTISGAWALLPASRSRPAPSPPGCSASAPMLWSFRAPCRSSSTG